MTKFKIIIIPTEYDWAYSALRRVYNTTVIPHVPLCISEAYNIVKFMWTLGRLGNRKIRLNIKDRIIHCVNMKYTNE